MTLTELKTFLAIIETGSLVRASERLNVTQSTVTARLKSLEDTLGHALIYRNKSGATLTAAGVRLRTFASTISDLWRQAEQEVALPDGLSAMCNLACVPEIWPSLGEPFFNTLRLHFPEVAISVWVGSEDEVSQWLVNGKCDLAFSHSANLGAHQNQIKLRAERLILVSSNPKTPVKGDPTYIYTEMGEVCGREHAIFYSDAGTARLSFNSAELGLRHLLNVGGSTYLPAQFAKPFIESGQLFEVANAPVFERPCYLVLNAKAQANWRWFDDCFQRFADQI